MSLRASAWQSSYYQMCLASPNYIIITGSSRELAFAQDDTVLCQNKTTRKFRWLEVSYNLSEIVCLIQYIRQPSNLFWLEFYFSSIGTISVRTTLNSGSYTPSEKLFPTCLFYHKRNIWANEKNIRGNI